MIFERLDKERRRPAGLIPPAVISSNILPRNPRSNICAAQPALGL